MNGKLESVAVLGAGAVGSILAANLAKAGHDVIIIEAAKRRREQIKKIGLTVKGKGDVTAQPKAILASIQELEGHTPRAIFICTKTWALKTILPQLSQSLHPEALVVSFQNGIGTEDTLAEHFPEERVARGIVNYAGGIGPDGGTTLHWFNPPNYLGPLREDSASLMARLATALSGTGFYTAAIPCHEVKHRAFFKTVLNSALNALCAINGITMRQAMSQPHTRNMARVLIREGLSVASSVGYTYGEKAMEICMKYLDEGGDHLPSMWTDLQNGALTEIEFINGKIAKIGLMFKNVDVTANIFFTSLVITQEIKSGARKPDEVPDFLKHF